MKPKTPPPPFSLENIAPEALDLWVADRREMIVRDGHDVRAGDRNTIEVKTKAGDWRTIMLPDGAAIAFVTAEQRDAVLARLKGVQ